MRLSEVRVQLRQSGNEVQGRCSENGAKARWPRSGLQGRHAQSCQSSLTTGCEAQRLIVALRTCPVQKRGLVLPRSPVLTASPGANLTPTWQGLHCLGSVSARGPRAVLSHTGASNCLPISGTALHPSPEEPGGPEHTLATHKSTLVWTHAHAWVSMLTHTRICLYRHTFECMCPHSHVPSHVLSHTTTQTHLYTLSMKAHTQAHVRRTNSHVHRHAHMCAHLDT